MVADVFRVIFILIEVVLIFNLMILVHEWGHYLAARWRGLVVEKFAIWFGKPIWSKTINGVEYRLGSIPAGGFVAIPQLAPMEMMEGEVENDRTKLPPVKPIDKIIVAFAGPLFSFLLALLIACVVWVFGRPVGQAQTNTVIGYVAPDSPAAKAGLLPGDKITEVDHMPVKQFGPAGNARASIVWNVARSEASVIPITFERSGQIQTVDVEPAVPERSGWGRKNLKQIGVSPAFNPQVARVIKGSPEAAAGFQGGDVILEAAGKPVHSDADLIDAMSAAEGKPLPVLVERGDQTLMLQLPPSPAVIGSVMKGGAAAEAGLKAGDEIVALNGVPVAGLTEFAKVIREGRDKPVQLTIKRGSETFEKTLTPRKVKDSDNYLIGIEWKGGGIEWNLQGRMTRIHPNPIEQVVAGATTMFDTLAALFSPKSGIGLQHLSGPVGIMNVYYYLFQEQDGWLLALWFSVVLNINLAILNLLPIPVLDGGHITLAIIEGIMRRPISVRILEVVQNGCALVIIGFILYVTFFDTLDLPFLRNRQPAVQFEQNAP